MNRLDPPTRSKALERGALLEGVELVVFDFDGVIADSEVISLATLQRSLAAFGIELSVPEVRHAFLGASLATITDYVTKHSPRKTSKGFADTWQTALFAGFRTDLQPVPHLEGLLDHLDVHGVRYCIASSGTFERIGIALAALNLSERFDVIFSAEQVARGKPAPDLFLHAAAQLGVPPAHCLVIEDSQFGVCAAQSARMRSVGFVGGSHLKGIEKDHGALLLRHGATCVVTTLRAISQGH